MVGNLAAHFGVHGSLVQHQNGIALVCGLLQLVLGNDSQDLSLTGQGLRLGIEDYIIKPFAYERLREAVQRYTSKASLVRNKETADQAVVDQLLSNALPREAPRDLRKGLNAKTLQSIESLLRSDQTGEHTCESISAASGLSKVTVRHYLNYLIETGQLTSSIDYETGGRPRVLYRMK